MSSLTYFILGLASLLPIYGQNTSCPNNFMEFSTCIYQRLDALESSQSVQPALVNPSIQASITKCFKDNGCWGPIFDHDPCTEIPQPFRSYVDKVRQEIGSVPPEVDRCLKAKFTRSTGECIAALGLGQLITSGPNQTHVFGDASSFFFGGGNETAEKKRSAIIQVNIATAVRMCRENTSDENRVQRILQCVANANSDARRQQCDAANKCDGPNASTDCKRQHRQFLRLLCQCRREKQNDVLKKLDELRSKNKNALVLDVLAALGNGRKPEDTCNDIRTCFTDNYHPPPPTLALLDLIIAMQRQPTALDKNDSSQMCIDRPTLGVIRDLYDAGDYGDDECKICDI